MRRPLTLALAVTLIATPLLSPPAWAEDGAVEVIIPITDTGVTVTVSPALPAPIPNGAANLAQPVEVTNPAGALPPVTQQAAPPVQPTPPPTSSTTISAPPVTSTPVGVEVDAPTPTASAPAQTTQAAPTQRPSTSSTDGASTTQQPAVPTGNPAVGPEGAPSPAPPVASAPITGTSAGVPTPGAQTPGDSRTGSPTSPAPAAPSGSVGDGKPRAGTLTTDHWPGRKVAWKVAVPNGPVKGTIIVLHGRSDSADKAFNELGLQEKAQKTGFALAAIDGEETYWSNDDGADTSAMLADDFLPLLQQQGLPTQKIGFTGYSMGGLGALLMGERLGPDRVFAVAPMSAAVWEEGRPGVEGKAQQEVRDNAAKLGGIPTRIVSGTDDDLTPSNQSLAKLIPGAETEWTAGGHGFDYWSPALDKQLAWMTSKAPAGSALSTTPEPGHAPARPTSSATQTDSPTEASAPGVPTPGEPTAPTLPVAPAPQRPAPDDNVKHASGMSWQSGVFAHSKDRVAKYQEVTGHKVDVLSVAPSRGSWDSIMDPWWLDTAPEGFNGTLDVAVPLWQKDGDLATAAAGGYDKQWEDLGLLVEQRRPGSSVRIGWEFNLAGWDHHATPENVEQWKQAFRHASAALQKGGPSLLVVWNPNKGKGDSLPDASMAWPGDESVDIVGLDAYDWWPAYSPETWPEHRDGDQGWAYWVNFARQHGKQFSVPEWGVAPGNDHGGGDNPYYIDVVLKFLNEEEAKDGIIHSVNYFDEPEAYIANSVAAGQVPKTAQALKDIMNATAGGNISAPVSVDAPSPPPAPSEPSPRTPASKSTATASPKPAERDWSSDGGDHGPVPP